MRRARWIVLASLFCASIVSAQDGSGLTARADSVPWARWQGRIGLGMSAPFWYAGLTDYRSQQGMGLKFGGVSLLGDYYFAPPLLGARSVGGFRATSGVLIGARTSLWAGRAALAGGATGLNVSRAGIEPLALGAEPGSDGITAPYVGVGYTGLAAGGSWSLSADVGVLGLTPGNAVRLGRLAGNSAALDDAVRDMRYTPVLQLGVSYSF
ncbi:MAG: hypothetical protein JSR59_25060 [Proteobacteria bacterium]|nr:hypothetical protein [Pseudomonadota bacterium]